MENQINIAKNKIESGNTEIEISLKSDELNDAELLLKGIEVLIESINLDQDQSYESMKRILYIVADRIGFNGWYDLSSEFDIKYNEESDEDYVSNREKRLLLRQFIENEEE